MEELDFNALTRRDENDSRGVMISSKQTYKSNEYYVTVRLTDLKDVEFTSIEDEETGEEVRGLFIPFDVNGLHVSQRKNVSITFSAVISQVPSPKYTHLLKQVMDDETRAKQVGRGIYTPYVGFMRPSNFKRRGK